MPQFRKKAVLVEAQQLNPGNTTELQKWLNANGLNASIFNRGIVIETYEGNMKADYGDWIVKEGHDFYRVKDNLFQETYDLIEGSTNDGFGTPDEVPVAAGENEVGD